MAVTGSLIGITPGSRGAGFPVSLDVPEASSQTYTLGAPIVINGSGQAAELATNGTLIYGFSGKAGQNGASDGAKTAKVYKIGPNDRFEGMLSVTSWDQSFVGSKVALARSSSTWYLATATSISSIAQCVVLGVSSKFAAADSKPYVYFSVLNANTQGEV